MSDSDGSSTRLTSVLAALILIAGILIGGIVSSFLALQEITNLNNKISVLQTQVTRMSGARSNVTNQNITIYQNSTALSELYETVKDSVVMVVGESGSETVQGSGFVYAFQGTMVVITNYHVVHGVITDLSVTFSNGNGYPAVINGTDPYSDLAVLVVDAPEDEFKPLDIVNSSALRVGDPVIAIGNPYGLVGSMTTGVVSALGRTISEDEYTGGFGIANIIQTSAPINPGNSGGPLLNYVGKVVGITTAIIADSQGLGFAVPSNAISREIESLFRFGTFSGHSYLGLVGTNMDYQASVELGVNVTYGWRVVEVRVGDPSWEAGLRVDDVLIGMNITAGAIARIRDGDDMASYLAEKTLPHETVTLTIIRKEGETILKKLVNVVLDERPPPPS